MGIMNNAGELNTAEKGFSRRNFLMGAASAGALAVLGLSGCAPKGKDELSDTGASATGADVNWDEETEVLVVGSGYAGLAAVLRGRQGRRCRPRHREAQDGRRQLRVRRRQIAVVGSAAQKAAGIEDSIETFMNDALTAGLNLNYKDKLQLVGEKSNEVFEWTVSRDRRGVGPGRGHRGRGLQRLRSRHRLIHHQREDHPRRGAGHRRLRQGRDLPQRPGSAPRRDRGLHELRRRHGPRPARGPGRRRHGHAAGPDPVLSLHEPRGGLLRAAPPPGSRPRAPTRPPSTPPPASASSTSSPTASASATPCSRWARRSCRSARWTTCPTGAPRAWKTR